MEMSSDFKKKLSRDQRGSITPPYAADQMLIIYPFNPIGILLPGTELPDSPVWMEFGTESFQVSLTGCLWRSTSVASQ